MHADILTRVCDAELMEFQFQQQRSVHTDWAILQVGSIQPIRAIAEVAGLKNVLMHSDAAQSMGKVPLNVKYLGVDMMTIVSGVSMHMCRGGSGGEYANAGQAGLKGFCSR